MSAGKAYPARRTGKAGAQVVPGFNFWSRELCPSTSHSGLLGGWLRSQLSWVPHRGLSPQLAEQGGRGLPSWIQRWREVRSVCTLPDSRFRSWTYQDAADTAPSSRGLSAASLPSWTGPPAPAGLATKPKNKVTGLLHGSSHRLIPPACPPSLGHLSHGAPSSHTG